eukprot:scaffold5146_cov37-Prasinocladus_malaysianus.AAC.1
MFCPRSPLSSLMGSGTQPWLAIIWGCTGGKSSIWMTSDGRAANGFAMIGPAASSVIGMSPLGNRLTSGVRVATMNPDGSLSGSFSISELLSLSSMPSKT